MAVDVGRYSFRLGGSGIRLFRYPIFLVGADPQATINQAAAKGGRVVFPAGTVWRDSYTIADTGTGPVTIELPGGAGISGADIVNSGWSNALTDVWTHNGTGYVFGLQTVPTGWPAMSDMMRRRELVLVNGVPLKQVDSAAACDAEANTFFADDVGPSIRVHLSPGQNPNGGVTVEMAARASCLTVSRPDVRIVGGTFTSCATPIQGGAVIVSSSAARFKAEQIRCAWNVWSGLRSQADDVKFDHCETSDNGISGFGISNCDRPLMHWHQNHRNNWRGAQHGWLSWEAGCKFYRVADADVRYYYANNNWSWSLWFDNGCTGLVQDFLITNSQTLSGDRPTGMFVEANMGPLDFTDGVMWGVRDGIAIAGMNSTYTGMKVSHVDRSTYRTTGAIGRTDGLDRKTGTAYTVTLVGNTMVGSVLASAAGQRINQHETNPTGTFTTQQQTFDSFVQNAGVWSGNTYYTDLAANAVFTGRVANAFDAWSLAEWQAAIGSDADAQVLALSGVPARAVPAWFPDDWTEPAML